MSDPILTEEERRLRGVLRAEEETLPVRLRPEDLGHRWRERRRRSVVRRVEVLVAVVVVVAVGLGAIWTFGRQGDTPTADGSPMIAGPISVTETFATGPGFSIGRATLSLSEPKSSPSSFEIGCGWSPHGHVVGLTIGKQVIGGEYLFVRWKLALGPQYQIELVEPDQTSFIGLGGNYVSQAAADGHTGSIVFTNLTLNAGDPSTAPRRSGTFTWTCDQPATLGNPAPSLPSPTVDGQGVPALWILQNGIPVRRAVTGCPIELNAPPGHSVTTSCPTSNWWESLAPLDSVFKVGSGDTLAFALDGWTVTSAIVLALPASAGGPAGSGPSVDAPLEDLHPVLGNGAVTFSPPGPGSWYLHLTVEAAMDDGSTLSAEYSYPITVP